MFRTMFFCGIAIMTVVSMPPVRFAAFVFSRVHLRQVQRMLATGLVWGSGYPIIATRPSASFTWRMTWITQADRDSNAHRNDPYN
jgi:hypothetical protein